MQKGKTCMFLERDHFDYGWRVHYTKRKLCKMHPHLFILLFPSLRL